MTKKSKNIYHTVAPSKMKSHKFMDARTAFREGMVEVLRIFIEVECGNKNVKYCPKPENIKFERGRMRLLLGNGVELEEYRGISPKYICIDESFVKIVDLYFWFMFEYKEFVRDVIEDYDISVEVPDGENFMLSERLETGGSHYTLNPNRKYPDYKRKYTDYNIIPDGYIEEVDKEKMKELVDVYPGLWL